jgi:hypothetical protein
MIPFFSSDTDVTIKVYGVHANMCTVHCLKRHGLLERAALVERSTSLRGTKCHILQSNVPPSFDTSIYCPIVDLICWTNWEPRSNWWS